MAVPFEPPKHDGWVNEALLNAKTFGCVTHTCEVAVQPFAVVAVTV